MSSVDVSISSIAALTTLQDLHLEECRLPRTYVSALTALTQLTSCYLQGHPGGELPFRVNMFPDDIFTFAAQNKVSTVNGVGSVVYNRSFSDSKQTGCYRPCWLQVD